MRLFDTHTHLQSKEFRRDRDETLQRAWDAGLEGLLVLGVDLASSEAAVAMAEADERVFAAAGFHPHDAKGLDDDAFAAIAALARHPRVVAVGEIGLDFYRKLSPREAQLSAFERQLALAVEVARPVAVHCRDAAETMYPLLESWARRHGPTLPDGRPVGVLHYYSEDAEPALRYVELGFVISIHTSVTHPKAEHMREVARRLPLDRLVVETDSPYGAPQAMRGKRNEPAFVAEAVRCIADVRDDDVETVAARTTKNALQLFGIAAAVAAGGAR
jgi:TatD DNase family protein